MIGGFSPVTPEHKRLLVHELGGLKIADFGLSKSLKRHHRAIIGGAAGGGGGNGRPSLDLRMEEMFSRSSRDSRDGIGAAAAASLPGTPGSGNTGRGGAAVAPRPRETDAYEMTGKVGSYRYMAPEVFRQQPYNHKVDVYAFAMICYQLFMGLPQFWMHDALTAATMMCIEGKRPEFTGES